MPPIKVKQDPSMTVDGVELRAHGRRLNFEASADTDSATFDRPFGSAYTIEIEVFQSFGADGFETLMRPKVNTLVPVVYSPADGAVASEANPHFRCTARVPPFTIVASGIDEYSPFTMTMSAEEGTTEKTIDGTTWTAI